ncbi:hypothetical protein G7054_g7470 [Neopestalotiopsis clavispora]|nr:hypothetical protein G7054_g7470 [Neopestalotiopsis clavispora]
MSSDEFRSRMDTLVQRVHGVTPAEGFSEVLFPGEPEYRLSVQRSREGIPFADAEKDMFEEIAKKYGVEPLPMSTTAYAL